MIMYKIVEVRQNCFKIYERKFWSWNSLKQPGYNLLEVECHSFNEAERYLANYIEHHKKFKPKTYFYGEDGQRSAQNVDSQHK
jgi:hypothetical protein